MCIDEDVDRARRTFAASLLRYGLGRPGGSRDQGYRGHFGRMGFDEELTRLEARRDAGASMDGADRRATRRADAPGGLFRPPDGAPEAFLRLARGLDTPLLRMITTRPGPEKVALALQSVAPGA